VKEKRSIAFDAVAGPPIAVTFARVCTIVGETDAALRELETLVAVPFGITANHLRHDSCWDSLRGDPRFARLLGE
jgi:hypothetical protein